MGFIKNYFERKRQDKLLIQEALAKREEAILAEAAAQAKALLDEQKEKEEKEATELAEKEAKETIERNEKLRMESPVPWYELIGDKYDIEKPPLAPVTERYRWNKAFITYLREELYVGQHDYDVIAAWEKDVEEKRAIRIALIRREEKKKSDEPWVEIATEVYDPDTKQVSITLDWNYAMIKMLRANGYKGNSEQEIIDLYFKRLSEDIAGEIHGTKYDG